MFRKDEESAKRALRSLPSGKLDSDILQRLLSTSYPQDGRVVVGPKVGEDAAVIGEIREQQDGVHMSVKGAILDLPRFERDEVAWIFEPGGQSPAT